MPESFRQLNVSGEPVASIIIVKTAELLPEYVPPLVASLSAEAPIGLYLTGRVLFAWVVEAEPVKV
tara:strand:+ start:663 stop:860 length:198 start_codon:yes stop_codon:yes gene_type:complete